jgi:hypothetical protein
LEDINWRDVAGDFDEVEFILNVRGNRVIAMHVPNGWVDAESTDVFAVFNAVTNISGAQRLTGFIDGIAGSVVTENRGDFDPDKLKTIELWQLDVADGVIKDNKGELTPFVTGTAISDQSSILTITGAAFDTGQTPDTSINGEARISYASDVVVYRADGDTDPTYRISSVTSITRNATVYVFNNIERDDDYPTDLAVVIIWHP